MLLSNLDSWHYFTQFHQFVVWRNFTYCGKTKVMFNTLTSIINPKYNMIATIWYFITNILLLWNEVESWIVSNRIPHYQVTKYRCHFHLRSRKCAGNFSADRACWSNCTRLASPACRQRHRSRVVWNLTFCRTLSFSAKMSSCTPLPTCTGRYVFQQDGLLEG